MVPSASSQLIGHLFLQLALILLTCRAAGIATRRYGQPAVIAEMVAGFVLGPSLLGWVAPTIHAAIFPDHTLTPLYVLSQVGLVLYMFSVGLEFETSRFVEHARKAVAVAVAGFVLPFAIGSGLAIVMFDVNGLFGTGVTRFQAAIFLGAAMSVTAFPMLARIIEARGIANTPVGTLALAAGAISDVGAWVMLAFVTSSFGGSFGAAALPMAGGVLYLLALYLATPSLQQMARAARDRGALAPWMLSIVFCILAFSAWFTERVGIYSVFGAFTLGCFIPRGLLVRELRSAIVPITTALLVPLYFAYSGLHARLSLLSSLPLVALTVITFLAACAGKGLACWAAARWSGASNREALGIATLMNTRGMMELVLLNIALQRGLITPTLFTMLAVMAIGTTLMAYPVFGSITAADRRPADSTREPGYSVATAGK
jgi:Kef-type K+ transport system membrane component KefB